MIDQKVISQLIEEQISKTVNEQVLEYFKTDDWVKPIEAQIIKYTQDRILGKFANASALPEIVDTIKTNVEDLFANGHIPGLETFVKADDIQRSVDLAVQNLIDSAIDQLGNDSLWLAKVEKMINQQVADKTIARISGIDIKSIIVQQVNENLDTIKEDIVTKVTPRGIQDVSSQIELTVLDQNVIVENTLSAKDVNIVGTATVKNLAVTGTINVDNASWNELSNEITRKTVSSINEQWVDQLVAQVSTKIRDQGIDFDTVSINGELLVNNGHLSSKIRGSSLTSVGELDRLNVAGEAHINNTISIVNRRVGINTREPEMALGVWDDEISLIIGKLKSNTAYVGTSRSQSLTFGVNREPHVEIDINGLTTVKKLQVGLHRIGHGTEVPGYAGTRGDIVFNGSANIDNNVFAWICLGGHKWKVLKSA